MVNITPWCVFIFIVKLKFEGMSLDHVHAPTFLVNAGVLGVGGGGASFPGGRHGGGPHDEPHSNCSRVTSHSLEIESDVRTPVRRTPRANSMYLRTTYVSATRNVGY